MKKGEVVRRNIDNEGNWVPALIVGDQDADGKFEVDTFPGSAKDNENLQAPVNEEKCGPGDKIGELQPL